MLADLRAHPDEWENNTPERFLDALAASPAARPSAFNNRGERLPEPPTWQVFAEARLMAPGYE